MLFFFIHYNIKLMVYYSIIAAIAYILYFILLAKEMVAQYLWCVYATIVLYMAFSTVSVGYNYGFHLYCMSMIPIIFYTKYMSVKLNTPDPHPVLISVIIVIAYLVSTGIALINGPLYTIGKKISLTVFVANSVSVFCFLIYYTKMILNLVMDSEEKLTNMAHKDQLTGLYNRHYMIEYLENSRENMNKEDKRWLAMLDVDDFKKINDTYGHNSGDYILRSIADIMKEQCKECVIARWGGEEFLVEKGKSCEGSTIILEKLLKTVEKTEFKYDGNNIEVTVTIGIAKLENNENADQWIKHADDNLYYGKNNGKNQIVERI